MKYLMLLTNRADQIAEWDQLGDEEKAKLREAEIPKWNALFGRMHERGQWVDGLELDEPKVARSIRVRDGETMVTDGPYAETKEQIGGLVLVECSDLDEAIELAARIPVAEKASVEIRPVVER